MSTHLVNDYQNDDDTRCGRVALDCARSDRLADVDCRTCLKYHALDERQQARDDALDSLGTTEADVEPVRVPPQDDLDRKIAERKVAPPLNREQKRAERRRLKKGGIDPDLMFVRYDITAGAIAKLEADEGDWTDLVLVHLQAGLRELEAQGGEVRKLTIITLGDHPRNPGGVSIEVKTKDPSA